MASIFYYSLEEMTGCPTRLFYPSDEEYEQFGIEAYEALYQGEVFIATRQMQRSDGSRLWARMSGKSIDKKHPEYGSIWIFEDISRQKAAEDAFIESKNRLHEAQRIAHLGNWEYVHATDTLHWSDEIYRIFELDQKQFGASYEAFLNAIHPDDRMAVNDAYHYCPVNS